MKQLSVIHFNDVHEFTESKNEPVGGAARFYTSVKELRKKQDTMMLFSGDAFSPSVMSSVTCGEHILPILNELNIQAASLGNHDFDFGIEKCAELTSRTNFAPWLLSNIVDNSGNFLANAISSKIIQWNGIAVGVLGLAEEGWKEVTTCFGDDITYLDQAINGTEIAARLREDGAEIVVAITHSRLNNDIYLAQHSKGIDIILGGHDHIYYIHHVNGIPIINSGSNFKQLTHLQIDIHPTANPLYTPQEDRELSQEVTGWKLEGPRVSVSLKRFDIDSSIPPDPKMLEIVESVSEIMEKMKKQVLGSTGNIWDARAKIVRTTESAVGNFITDIMRKEYKTDMALLQGGGFRSNDTYGPGEITMGDIMKIFPYLDPTVVFEIEGRYIREALENGFSKYPQQEGRFPQLSGCWVKVDCAAEPGCRLLSVLLGEDEETSVPLDDDKLYTVASRAYTMNGGDGYSSFSKCTRVIVDDENGMPASTLIRKAFLKNKVLNALNHQKRVDCIFTTSLSIFAGTEVKSCNKLTIDINIQAEGRIQLCNQIM